MRINHNTSALNTWRMGMANQKATEKAIGVLSSGLRINQASDDAAGLSISEKMRAQIRGLSQASRNIQDGISLVQTAEGGLNEVHSLLQRGRELSVQAANDTNTSQDKQNIQEEIKQIKNEVDRIAKNTEFNTINLLDQAAGDADTLAVIDLLKNQWLGQAEKRIKDYYDIEADNVTMTVYFNDTAPGGEVAHVSAAVPAAGKGINLELHIDMADYRAGILDDGIIAHEMVHAILDRTVNVGATTGLSDSFQKWFNEGSAELIRGADDQVQSAFAILGGNTVGTRTAIKDAIDFAWGDTANVNTIVQYAGAYVALRFLNDKLEAAGKSMKDIFDYMEADPVNRTLSDAIGNAGIAGYSNLADFLTDFDANGEAFIAANIDTSNADVGAIGGADASGGAAMTKTDVVADTPLAVSKFNMVYPVFSNNMYMHIGANTGQTMAFSLTKVDSASIGIQNVDVVADASGAITAFDNAIATVSKQRSRFGAIQNRLEHAMQVATNSEENLTSSESRIRDADMAKEMMNMTKMNILSQATSAMLAQANQSNQAILQLLH